MGYKRIPHNKTKYVEMGGILSKLSGRNNAIYIKNHWQRAIDNDWASLMNMAHYIEQCTDTIQTIVRFNAISKDRGIIHDANIKRRDLYAKIESAIKEDQQYSERMLKIQLNEGATINNFNAKNMTVSTGDIQKYVESYPHIEIKTDMQLIRSMEQDINYKKQKYRENIASLRDYFEQFKLELIKLKSKNARYESDLEEGKNAVLEDAYLNSIFYKYSSNENKYLLKLSTERHSHEQVRRTIKHYEEIKEKVESILGEDIEKRKTSIISEYEAGACLED
ncbi:MAG: hypothetical protein PHX21_13820 [bacterium]|nr:hypothetical protein [bacterium]